MKRSFALVVGALGLVACGDRDSVREVVVLPPVALDQHVTWVDTENEQILLLDLARSRPEPEVQRHDLPKNPFSSRRRNGENELLILSAGDSDQAGQLSVVGPKGVDRSYDLGASFDRMIQSEDGRYAFLHFSSDGGGNSGSLLFNPNEVAIIDLDKDGDDAITARTLRSFGGTPQQVVVSPPMDIAGEARRLAVVLFGSQLALLDLEHLDRPEYTIELSQNQINLSQVRFSREDARIYLLAANSQDIYVINLFPAGDHRENDFEPSVNQLGAGAQPTDMAVYGSEQNRRLLAISGSRALVIEASSNRVTDVPLSSPAESILLYEGSSPFDDNVEQRALLYGLNSSVVTFLDLDDVEERITRNLEVVRLGGAIASAAPLKDGNVLLVHKDSGLTVLNLESRTPSRINAKLPLNAAIPDLEHGRIWVAPAESRSLGFLTLEQFQTGQVNLDDGIQQLLLLKGKKQLAVVTHASAGGKVTIVDAEDPKNTDHMLTLDGFFYSNVLDR